MAPTEITTYVPAKYHRFIKRRRICYTSKDLKVFRYNFKIDQLVVNTLTELNLIRTRIKRRGCRAGINKNKGLLNRSGHQCIGRIDNKIRNQKHLKKPTKSSCARNLIIINRDIKIYSYPKIILANCRSIRNKFDELCLTTEDLEPDLAIFTETWLKESDLNAFDMNGFTALHRVRDRYDKNHGGGISVYIKNCISVLSVKYPEQAEIEVITVLFRTSNMQRIIPFLALVAVYSPPVNAFAEINIEYIMAEIDRIKSINIEADIFVIGDFNDLELDSKFKKPYYKQLITRQTCNTKLIDKCFYSGKIKYNVEINAPISTSDHKLISLSPENYVKREIRNACYLSRPRRNSCYRNMWSALNNIQWKSTIEIDNYDDAIESFHSIISSCYDRSFPIVKTKIKDNKSWFNKNIKNAMEKRKSLFNNNQTGQLQEINKEIKQLIKDAKHREYLKFDKMITNKQMNFYNVVKSYGKSKNENSEIIFPGEDIKTTIDMTADYYGEILNRQPSLNMELLPAYLPGLPIKPITEQFVYSQLKKVKNDCSSAPDGIPNFILREYAYELTHPITYLMNRSLKMGYCPKLWKKNYLITIPKKNVISTPSDLRPIVISSAIIKILEKFIYSELLPSLLNKLDRRQFGGLPGRSAENYLTFYLDTVHKNLDKLGNRVTTIITDYSKAYDAVDHNLFMIKLLSMDAPPSICNWISSFLDKRSLQIKWNNTPTDKSFLCTNGAPQGSVLGGLIFSIVVNDVAMDWEHRLKFVDDLTVLCIQSDKDDNVNPQKIVNSIIKDSQETKMSLNKSKCHYMVHCFSKHPTSFNLTIESQILSRVNQYKIIGVIIQENLKWDSHIESIVAKTNKKFYLLYKLKNVGMCTKLLTKVYYTYIRPCMEYCCSIWHSSITKAQAFELEKIQKRALRIILGGNFTNYNDALKQTGLESLANRRNKLLYNYATKFLSSYPDFKPATRQSISQINTRSASKLCEPKCRTSRYKTSPIPSIINAINQAI